MDDPQWLTSEDPVMANAMRQARASFWEFARTIELENWRIVPVHEATLVKAFFADPANKSRGEFLFVDDVAISKTTVRGTLVSQPQTRGLSAGQPVSVPIENICDWFLVIREKGIGGFTVDILKKTIPADELDEYESVPPVSWYRHRKGNLTAQNELDQVLVCKKCGKRDLFDLSYRDGVCGCCVNGLSRTNCPACGVPLFRAADAPPQCFQCAKPKSSPHAKKPWWKFW